MSSVFAQTSTATPTAKTDKQPLRPKATTKGVGTKKIAGGTKNAGRETEGTVGKDAGKVKKSLSKDRRKVRNAFSKRKPKEVKRARGSMPRALSVFQIQFLYLWSRTVYRMKTLGYRF